MVDLGAQLRKNWRIEVKIKLKIDFMGIYKNYWKLKVVKKIRWLMHILRSSSLRLILILELSSNKEIRLVDIFYFIWLFNKTLYTEFLKEVTFILFPPKWKHWPRLSCSGNKNIFLQLRLVDIHTMLIKYKKIWYKNCRGVENI